MARQRSQPTRGRRGLAALAAALQLTRNVRQRLRGSYIRIATWNACKTASSKLPSGLTALAADFAVLQEVRQPKSQLPGLIWAGENPRIGLAAFAAPPWSVAPLPQDARAPWSIVPLSVGGPKPFTALLVWTRKEHNYLLGLDAALTAYTPLLKAGPCLVIGDFNSNVAWDNPKLPTDFSRLSRRLDEEFGLESVYHRWFAEPFGGETHATHHFWRQPNRPFHIDFCFLPKAWIPLVERVTIPDTPPWSVLSDHRPILVDMALGAV